MFTKVPPWFFYLHLFRRSPLLSSRVFSTTWGRQTEGPKVRRHLRVGCHSVPNGPTDHLMTPLLSHTLGSHPVFSLKMKMNVRGTRFFSVGGTTFL